MPGDYPGLSAQEASLLEDAAQSFRGAMEMVIMRENATIPSNDTTSRQVDALIRSGVLNTMRLTMAAVRQAT